MKLKHVSILLAAGLIILSMGCGSQTQQSAPAPKASFDKNAPGYQVFAQTCAGCHGADLQGVVGPNLTQVGASLSKDQIQTQILNGGGGMPSFKDKLNTQQVNDLVDFLSKLK